jgi:PAS domain S-box-containing protein
LQGIQHQYNWLTPPVDPGYALIWLDRVVIVTDIALRIIHATENVYSMSGYDLHELSGNSMLMLQGTNLNGEGHNVMRTAFDKRQPFEMVINNVKKDGTAYKCRIKVYPVLNKTGLLVNFLVFANKVSAPVRS